MLCDHRIKSCFYFVLFYFCLPDFDVLSHRNRLTEPKRNVNLYCIDPSSLLRYILTSTALALYDLCLLDYKMPDNDIHFDKH